MGAPPHVAWAAELRRGPSGSGTIRGVNAHAIPVRMTPNTYNGSHLDAWTPRATAVCGFAPTVRWSLPSLEAKRATREGGCVCPRCLELLRDPAALAEVVIVAVGEEQRG